MEISEVKKQQILSELLAWNEQIKTANTGMTHAIERFDRLKKAEFHIEWLIMQIQLVEQNLKFILSGYVRRRRILGILGEIDPYAEVDLSNLEDEMIGTLIGKMKRLDGSALFAELLGKCNNLRKEVVHHLFNGNKDIPQLESRVKEFIQKEMIQIMNEIKRAMNKINDELVKLGTI